MRRGALASPVTIKAFMEDDPGLRDLGGPPYLARIAAAAISAYAAADIATMIRELATRRALIGLGQDIAARATAVTVDDDAAEQIKAAEQTLYALAEEGAGVSAEELEAARSRPTLADPASIVYTSGTTGSPKGAIITHGNFAAAAINVLHFARDVVQWNPQGHHSRTLLFLPLAHVLAHAVQVICLYARIQVAHAASPATLLQDLPSFRPTWLLAVPRVFEKLEAGIAAQAEHSGTTTFEIKTGYGLTLDDEIRQLDISNRHTDESTLIAAHVVPPEYKDDPEGYVDLVIDEIIPAAAGKAKWIDVFCEEGAFTEDQTARILDAGVAAGMRPRLHANQLTAGGALQLAAAHSCASADHATFASDADLAALAEAGTVATLLPGVEFSTRQPYPDARRFHAAGVTVAIASDCNPGSCFTSSIPFCIALAVRDMHFTVEQAVWSATAGGAAALERSDIGRLSPGARADFSILTAPSYRHLAYRPGVNLIAEVHRAGRPIAVNPS